MNRMWGVRLGDVVNVTMGQAPAGETYNESGEGLPLIAGAGDFGGSVVAAKKYTSSPTKVCRSGDIVMSIRATIGTKVVADRDYCLGRGVAGLRATSAMDQGYLWHWLTHIEPELASKGRGATFPQVSRADIADLGLELPPIDEQRRIAAILNKADGLRQKRKRAIALLDSLTQSIFLDIFGDPVTNPRDWARRRLEDVVEAVVDCPHTTPNWQTSGKIALRTSNLTNGGWDWSDTRYVTPEEFDDRIKRSAVRPGDIVLSREGTVGVAAIVQSGMQVCLGQRLVQIKPNTAKVLSEYLLAILLHELDPARIAGIMVGATSKHLNVKDLRALEIPVPPVELQKQFSDRARECQEMLERSRHARDLGQTAFASLQHRAFSGQL